MIKGVKIVFLKKSEVKSCFNKLNEDRDIEKALIVLSSCAPFILLSNNIDKLKIGLESKLKVIYADTNCYKGTVSNYIKVEQYSNYNSLNNKEELVSINHIFSLDKYEGGVSPFVFISKDIKCNIIKILVFGCSEEFIAKAFCDDKISSTQELLQHIKESSEEKHLFYVARCIDFIINSKVGGVEKL